MSEMNPPHLPFAARPVMQKNIRPYWGRVAVVETPVDEEERESGLVVPFELGDDLKRGMVIALDEHWLKPMNEYDSSEIIPVGTVVYYQGGVKIGDTTILNCDEIYAREEM